MTYSFARSNVQPGALRITHLPSGESRVIGRLLAGEFLDLQAIYPKESEGFTKACERYFYLGTFIPEREGGTDV